MSTSKANPFSSSVFLLVTRLFAGLKRAGRVTDVVWFQKNPEYAREVLRLAAEDDDESVRKLGADLQVHLRDFLAIPPPKMATAKVAAITVPAAAPVAVAAVPVAAPAAMAPVTPIAQPDIAVMAEPAPVEPVAPEKFVNQYIGRLR